jgi:hypothetical protein
MPFHDIRWTVGHNLITAEVPEGVTMAVEGLKAARSMGDTIRS